MEWKQEETEEEQPKKCEACGSENTETYIAAADHHYDEVYYGTLCNDCGCKTED